MLTLGYRRIYSTQKSIQARKKNMVERKDGKGSLGYRFYLHGQCYKKYAAAWTRAEAAQAERKKRVDLENNPPLPPTAFASVVAAYLVESAEPQTGRSESRVEGLSHSMENHIMPFCGDATHVAAINSEDVNKFIKALKLKIVRGAKLKGKTIKNIVTDLRACLNWAKRKKFIRDNPVDEADMTLIGSTKFSKAPLDLAAFDTAALSINNPRDRAWFDVTRFTGMRKDEANRLKWTDVRLDIGMIHVPGSKTEQSDAWLPLAPVAVDTLRALYKVSDANCPWAFPGRSSQTKGKKIYARRRMFERIEKKTGIHLTPKDLRDYFATVVSGQTRDANTLMRLMRHTSLTTTTKYLRTLDDSMRDAIKNLGAGSGGGLDRNIGAKTTQNDIGRQIEELQRELVRYGSIGEKVGGGGQIRTVDAADMSRGAQSSNLSETLTEKSAGAGSGGGDKFDA
jgi:integrase